MTAMEQAVMERMGYLQRYKVSGGNVAFCKLQNFGIFCLDNIRLILVLSSLSRDFLPHSPYLSLKVQKIFWVKLK